MEVGEPSVSPHLLNIQYRMHPAIAAFPSMAFYNGKLETGIDANDRRPPNGFAWQSMDFPIEFFNVEGAEQKHAANSYVNVAEVEKVERDMEERPDEQLGESSKNKVRSEGYALVYMGMFG